MEHLKAADFSKHLNTKFVIYRTGEEVFEGHLTEVLELRKSEQVESFSLVFLLPSAFGYEQRIYRLIHPVLGQLDLFLVPVGRTERGIRFEAIFNRLIKKL